MAPFAAKEMMNRRLQVAVSVEHSRGWGRRVCEGVCSYAQTHPDWRITMFDGVLPSVGDLKAFDGFLWSVSDACVAERLLSTGRPIVNLMVDGRSPATAEQTFSGAVSGAGKIVVANTGVVRYLWRDGEPTFGGFYREGFVTGGGTLRVRKSSRKSGLLLLVK